MATRFTEIVIDVVKLRDYCLNESHPRGKHKARVFQSRLGLTAADAQWLRQQLLQATEEKQDDLQLGENDEFGQRYVLDVVVNTSTNAASVRTAWIVLTGEEVLRLVTCYVL